MGVLDFMTSENKNLLFKQENSLIPTLKECERFIKFLDVKFNLDLPENLTLILSETKPNVKGFFRADEWGGNLTRKDNFKLNTIFFN